MKSHDKTHAAENSNPLPRTAPFMTDEIFLKERLDDQINWFDASSSKNQKMYRRYKFSEILIAGLIPLALAMSEMQICPEKYAFAFNTVLKIYIAGAGSAIVVISKYLEINNFKEYWISYRQTCELLRTEKYKYLSKADPYDEEDAFPLLVKNVDLILSRENQKWARTEKSAKKRKEEEKKNKKTSEDDDE